MQVGRQSSRRGRRRFLCDFDKLSQHPVPFPANVRAASIASRPPPRDETSTASKLLRYSGSRIGVPRILQFGRRERRIDGNRLPLRLREFPRTKQKTRAKSEASAKRGRPVEHRSLPILLRTAALRHTFRKRERKVLLARFSVFRDVQVHARRVVQGSIAQHFVQSLRCEYAFVLRFEMQLLRVNGRAQSGKQNPRRKSNRKAPPSINAAKSSGVLVCAAAKSGNRTPNSVSSREISRHAQDCRGPNHDQDWN